MRLLPRPSTAMPVKAARDAEALEWRNLGVMGINPLLEI